MGRVFFKDVITLLEGPNASKDRMTLNAALSGANFGNGHEYSYFDDGVKAELQAIQLRFRTQYKDVIHKATIQQKENKDLLTTSSLPSSTQHHRR